MRQVVLDTETTGIGVLQGHRIIEIGCVEIIDRTITDNTFHTYLNPNREVDEGAFKVHGISTEFLKDKPLFNEIATSFLTFVKGAELIIHNAAFDTGFINAELERINHKNAIEVYCQIIDSLEIARNKHPGQRNSLDALCKRYEIDNTHRQLHGALLDAKILAEVYLAMTGGQGHLFSDDINPSKTVHHSIEAIDLIPSKTKVLRADSEELAQHDALMARIEKKSGRRFW